jgi:citrate lyase subunit beta / citryl-CoA lyase
MAHARRKYSAGNPDPATRSDCYVELEPAARGGITVVLESKVESLYGASLRQVLMDVASALGVRHAAIRLVDQGALPCTVAARVETAMKRAFPETAGEYLPEAIASGGSPSAKDRQRRTRLYLPGNEPKYFPNASLHQPDCVVLDLEDSVAPGEKDAARILVRNTLRCVGFPGCERGVRINQGRAGLEDLRAVIPQRPDVILVPKCESAENIQRIETEIRGLERQHHLAGILLLPIIESALGVINAFAIASASARVCALAIGLEDYTADIGVERTGEGKESLYARQAVLTAAKAAGVQALDSVFSDVDDMEALRQSTLEAKALGFEGKGCIHPRQIEIIHAALAPTTQEIERARAIMAASEEARKNRLGVVALGSKMIDAPVVLRAERVLRMAGQVDRTKGNP